MGEVVGMGSPEKSTAEMRSGDGASLKMFSHICMCEGSVVEVWGSVGEEGCVRYPVWREGGLKLRAHGKV